MNEYFVNPSLGIHILLLFVFNFRDFRKNYFEILRDTQISTRIRKRKYDYNSVNSMRYCHNYHKICNVVECTLCGKTIKCLFIAGRGIALMVF